MKGKLESSCVLSCTTAGWAGVTGEERLTLGPQCPSVSFSEGARQPWARLLGNLQLGVACHPHACCSQC